MGMASSQVRLLQLIGRKHDIGNELQHLSLEKMSLTRDMRRVSKKYQDAVNTKVLKWSNNAGVSTVDLTYDTLMRPGSANLQKTFLITNNEGKVVLDSKYEKYAEMVAPKGIAGGNWEKNRSKILSELTGIPVEKIESSGSAEANADLAIDKLNKIREMKDKLEVSEPTLEGSSARELFEKAGSVKSNFKVYNISNLYNHGGSVDIGTVQVAKQNMQSLLSGISGKLSNFFTDDQASAFKEACNNFVSTNAHYIGGMSQSDKDGLDSGVTGISKKGKNYILDVKKVLDTILGSYKNISDEKNLDAYGNSNISEVFYTRDKNSIEWQTWHADMQALELSYNEAEKNLSSSIDSSNMSFTAEEESKIKFYDRLFVAISENGWECNDQVHDKNYLNNMFQNNQFFITTMDEQIGSDGKMDYDYITNPASNSKNIVSVNDADFQNKAFAEYEDEKERVKEKEVRIDTRMKNLETEQAAVSKMIEGTEKQKNDNIERTFNIFG